MSTTIYYFTGTGNSLKVTNDLQRLLPDCRLQSIPKVMKLPHILMPTETIGVIFPVYWFGVPLMVKRFLERLEAPQHTYFFAINTFGGLNGQSIYQTRLLLEQKGLTLQAGWSLWMPGNAQVSYPVFPQALQQFQFKRQQQRIQRIADIIKARGTEPVKPQFFPPLALFAKHYQGFLQELTTIDRAFWTDADCTHCGLCARVCPAQNIQCTTQAVTWQGRCEFCLACLQWCPRKAIQHEKYALNTLWSKRRYHHPEIPVNAMVASVI